jgi:hypothetical protein
MAYKYFGPKPAFSWLQVQDATAPTTTPGTPTPDPLAGYITGNTPAVGEVTIAGSWKKDPVTDMWVPTRTPDEDPYANPAEWVKDAAGAWKYVGPQPAYEPPAADRPPQFSDDGGNFNILASYIKDSYPTLTVNALFQSQTNTVAKFYEDINKYAPTADGLWNWTTPASEAMAEQLGVPVGTMWSPLHQALGVAAEGWGRMPAVFGIAEEVATPAPIPSTGDVGSVAAPAAKPEPTITYIRNTVWGPIPVSRESAMYFTRLGTRSVSQYSPASGIVEAAVEGVSNAMSRIFGPGGVVKLGGKSVIKTPYKAPPVIPIIPAAQLPQMLTPPPTQYASGGGGGSSKIAFDPEEVKLYLTKIWRQYLLDGLPEKQADKMASQYIDKATDFYASSKTSLDIEAWAVNQIKAAPRYKLLYRSKPPDMDELEWLNGFQQAASQAGLPEWSRASQIVASTSAGASSQGLFQRASRSRDVYAQDPNNFMNRLAQTAAQTIGARG